MLFKDTPKPPVSTYCPVTKRRTKGPCNCTPEQKLNALVSMMVPSKSQLERAERRADYEDKFWAADSLRNGYSVPTPALDDTRRGNWHRGMLSLVGGKQKGGR